MKVGVAKETAPGERRVALVPEVLGKLTAAGLDILVERGAGAGSSIPDAAYEEAGATIVSTDELYAGADAILRVAKPSDAEVAQLRSGQARPRPAQPRSSTRATAKALADRGVTAISLDAIPRTLSRAQTMDALSSQANVGGYKAVLIAANAYGRYFPLLTTAAGTAKPANVLILGHRRRRAPGDRHGPAPRAPSSRPTTSGPRPASRPRASAPSSSSSRRRSTRPAPAATPAS